MMSVLRVEADIPAGKETPGAVRVRNKTGERGLTIQGVFANYMSRWMAPGSAGRDRKAGRARCWRPSSGC